VPPQWQCVSLSFSVRLGSGSSRLDTLPTAVGYKKPPLRPRHISPAPFSPSPPPPSQSHYSFVDCVRLFWREVWIPPPPRTYPFPRPQYKMSGRMVFALSLPSGDLTTCVALGVPPLNWVPYLSRCAAGVAQFFLNRAAQLPVASFYSFFN